MTILKVTNKNTNKSEFINPRFIISFNEMEPFGTMLRYQNGREPRSLTVLETSAEIFNQITGRAR